MAEVTVTVNNRTYTLGCEAGQEGHVAGLARHLDAQVLGLVDEVGQVGEARLLLMAALSIIDDLGQAQQALAARDDEIEGLKAALQDAESFGVSADDYARRLEDVAGRLERV
jgi:cell division protein ZapA